jgi:hypothetical protein
MSSKTGGGGSIDTFQKIINHLYLQSVQTKVIFLSGFQIVIYLRHFPAAMASPTDWRPLPIGTQNKLLPPAAC